MSHTHFQVEWVGLEGRTAGRGWRAVLTSLVRAAVVLRWVILDMHRMGLFGGLCLAGLLQFAESPVGSVIKCAGVE